jgi:hypothetical protein
MVDHFELAGNGMIVIVSGFDQKSWKPGFFPDVKVNSGVRTVVQSMLPLAQEPERRVLWCRPLVWQIG